MAMFVGASGSALLFTENGRGAVVDTKLNIITDLGYADALSNQQDWKPGVADHAAAELAQAALTSLDISVTAAAGRLYTIPKAVSSEAKRSLNWFHENAVGGSRVGAHTATLLASGGQITLPEIKHIAKYFPRHTADSRNSGWLATDGAFPSAARVSWGLWGGDAAQRWTKSVIEAENIKALTADGYVAPGYDENPDVYKPIDTYPADVNPFQDALDNNELSAPEFIARILMDGSGIDRLYRVDLDGSVYIWDDGTWDDVGTTNGNIWDYDRLLDGPAADIEATHIIIDPESAIIIAAHLQQNPFKPVAIEDINADEAGLAAGAVYTEDWGGVDDTTPATTPVVAVGMPGDGIYTPAERSQNAEQQVRDASGKFAKMGSRVMVGGDPQSSGAITGMSTADGSITVRLDNGTSVTVPGRSVQLTNTPVQAAPTTTTSATPSSLPPLDLSGILGNSKTEINAPKAHLTNYLPAMGAADLHKLLNNYPAWVASERGKEEGKSGWKDPYKQPLIADWLADQANGTTTSAIGLTAASVAESNADYNSGTPETPDNSNVQPIYLAEVSPDDPRAVLELVAIVPASSTSTAPMTYKRDNGLWTVDPSILTDLQSATPPPVVPLDAPTLKDVLSQVDSKENDNSSPAPTPGQPITPPNPDVPVDQAPATANPAPVMSSGHELMVLWGPRQDIMEAVVAAGGLDRDRGGAEKLRRYWTVGPGAAKIRWNTPGDWTRCVRHLGKYLGPRAKGYCSLRHHETTGMWPGDKRNRDLVGRTASGTKVFSSDVLYSIEEIVSRAFLRAEARTLKQRMGIVAAVPPQQGARFRIPLIIPEGMESGDGRLAEPGSLTWRNLPLPLMWQVQTASGHDASYVVGRIDFMERTMEGIGNAWGYFDTGEFGAEAQRLVQNGMLRGISADLDQFEAQQEEVAFAKDDEDDKNAPDTIKKQRIVITQARIMGATIVAKPAFQECIIFIDDEAPQEDNMIPDGVYVDDVDPSEAAAIVAAGYVASAIPLEPPRDWFDNPALSTTTPITVTDEGRVFGHIAAWDSMHIGMANIRPPHSKTQYKYFHTGVLRTGDGTDVPVGQLTLAGGHASIYASADEAIRHYDDTASAIADVKAGEDQFGIWVAGALRTNASPEQIRALRASAPSGDWRPVKGNLELVAVCQVNVPGFPIARAVVASGGQVTALVAAGAAAMAKLQHDPVNELAHRLENLEEARHAELAAQVAGARNKVRDIRNAELAAKAEALSSKFESLSEFSYIPRKQRMAMAKKGQALPDGSFPIATVDDLHKAISAYGRAKDKPAARKHIMKRARALGQTKLIPDSWSTASSDAITASVENLKSRIAAVSADPKVQGSSVEESLAVKKPKIPIDDTPINDDPNDDQEEGPKYTPKTQPRDYIGRFRDVLARIKGNVGTSGISDAAAQIRQTENLDSVGNYKAAVESAAKLANTLTRISKGTGDTNRRDNLRSASTELSRAIANIPLPFGEDAQKVRFSDLPPAVREMTLNLVAQVEAKKGTKAAAPDVEAIKDFMSGFHQFSQRNISTQLNKLVHILTEK